MSASAFRLQPGSLSGCADDSRGGSGFPAKLPGAAACLSRNIRCDEMAVESLQADHVVDHGIELCLSGGLGIR